ncbi:MAG TPA: circularly permuted type 2 ATP-grasp protein, partial [Phycisphaerae bacterium]|nr:circularly permuted type 2 ATP-grasp protein [Phycisphaerae bacterium]
MDVALGSTQQPSSGPAANPAAHAAGFCKAYVPPTHVFDEMEEQDGSVRPHWQMFVNLLDDLGPVELEHRWNTARQLIHDNGVTYNVYGDPAGMDRPWNLDAIPFVIGAPEWSFLEAALTQRARLLDYLLADLYGPQKLLRDGLIPPELVFGHRGYLRPLHGVNVPHGRWLHFYAADICRGSDGRLFVMDDRTQAPSGSGYALENRLVVSRAMPDVFRDCRVQRLATFFRTVRETLKTIAPHNKETPRIVLLTPGPFNETYFEHAYLARYLGFTLVEAGDLTVRDNHVYLKTLSGLQQVDVILRRQDDDFCDPLELRGDSSLGIPGLVQAIHSGNVAVANALGTGMLETPALLMFLPRLCKHLFGEELKLPSVNSYWCGDAQARQYVLDNLPRLVIKPTFSQGSSEPIFGEALTTERLSEMRARILAAPADFVAEDQITLSTAPVLVGQKIESRHIVMRAHLAATIDSKSGNVNGGGHGSYTVMPGALTRFSASPDSLIVSMQRGGGSKDTWVLSGGPVDQFSLLPPAGSPVDITRAGGDLPSRVADNLYWLG